jgi:hypothetical protein
MTYIIAALASLVVVVVAAINPIRPGKLMWFGCWVSLLAAVVVFATPTPLGFDMTLGQHRPADHFMAINGSRIAGVLIAVSLAAFVCASGLRRWTTPIDE